MEEVIRYYFRAVKPKLAQHPQAPESSAHKFNLLVNLGKSLSLSELWFPYL
jgi:hypothetical protein